jgi:hypothetical protein
MLEKALVEAVRLGKHVVEVRGRLEDYRETIGKDPAFVVAVTMLEHAASI